MLKYIALLMMVLPTQLWAETNETVLQSIIDDYEAECLATREAGRDIDYDEDDPVIADLSLPSESIYEIKINGDGKIATVLYANFRCTGIGSAWCGQGGCTSYVIVDGVKFQTRGFRPVSAVVGHKGVAVIIPRAGGACVTVQGKYPSNDRVCYSIAAWDEISMTFNSLSSGEPVFKLTE